MDSKKKHGLSSSGNAPPSSKRTKADSAPSRTDAPIQLFVPGRICLFGEHSDWAGSYRRFNSAVEQGHAIVCGTRQGLYARALKHNSKLIMTSIVNGMEKKLEIDMDPKKLKERAAKGGFWSYACGVAYEVCTNYHVQGLELCNYKTDLPVKKGLSSSAALCVLVTRAFNRLYDLKLTNRGEMDIAYHGEIRTPSRCGRLDQCVAFGSSVVGMKFDGDLLSTRRIRIKEPLHIVLVDLHGKKDTTTILRDLQKGFPFPKTDVENGMHKLLGPINQDIVQKAIDAMESGSATAKHIGQLMCRAQENFDKYAIPACPSELTAPKLHQVLKYPAIQQHIWGGKGVGSQGDGTAQFVCKSAADKDKVVKILEKELDVACLPLEIGTVPKIRKAVIPAAGFGSRLFPASKVIKAPFMPIPGPNGILKPAILHIVEEALSAGIDDVYIISQRHDEEDFKKLFHKQLPVPNYQTLSLPLKEQERHLLKIGQKVTVIVQEYQLGFGHAVHCAKDQVGDEPFLLLLGDHIYKSTAQKSCTRQVLERATLFPGQNLVAVHDVDKDTLSQVGVVSGHWLGQPELDSLMESKHELTPELQYGSVLHVSSMCEKPSYDFAKVNYVVPGMKKDTFLGVFGPYVLQPGVFDHLEAEIKAQLPSNHKIELTPSLDRLRKEGTFIGLRVSGHRYDIGSPGLYAAAVAAFIPKPKQDSKGPPLAGSQH